MVFDFIIIILTISEQVNWSFYHIRDQSESRWQKKNEKSFLDL